MCFKGFLENPQLKSQQTPPSLPQSPALFLSQRTPPHVSSSFCLFHLPPAVLAGGDQSSDTVAMAPIPPSTKKSAHGASSTQYPLMTGEQAIKNPPWIILKRKIWPKPSYLIKETDRKNTARATRVSQKHAWKFHNDLLFNYRIAKDVD